MKNLKDQMALYRYVSKSLDTLAKVRYSAFMAKSTEFLGANLRRHRHRAKLSQTDLAHGIGHSGEDAGAYISKIESGKHVPQLGTLIKVARKLNISLEALLAK